MALVTNGSAVGIGTGVGTITATLTTSGAGIVVFVAHGSNATGAPATASGVSGAGLTWAQRGTPVTFGPGGFNNAFNTTTVWWAYSSGALASQVITLTWGGSVATATAMAFGVSGFTGTAFQTTPWDSNGSLPDAASATTTTAPSSTGASTTSTNSMLLAFVGSSNNSADPITVPSGFANVNNVGNGGGASGSMVGVAANVVAAAQSGITVTWGSNAAGWSSIVDALSENGNSGGGAAPGPVGMSQGFLFHPGAGPTFELRGRSAFPPAVVIPPPLPAQVGVPLGYFFRPGAGPGRGIVSARNQAFPTSVSGTITAPMNHPFFATPGQMMHR